MNNLNIRNFKKSVFLSSVFFMTFFVSLAYADNGNNPCAKYQDPQQQASCMNFLNAATNASQSVINQYKFEPKVSPVAPQTAEGASQYPQVQQPQAGSATSAPMEVVVPVQQPQTDTSTMTPWQIISKSHGKAVLVPSDTNPPPEVSGTSDVQSSASNHVNIYK